MKGWTQQHVVAPEGRTIYRCDDRLCRAHVGVSEGDDRRKQHDREFHLLRAERGGPNDGYLLHLDGKEIGYAYDLVQHYNLRRSFTTHQWRAVLVGGSTLASPWEGFRRSMNHFVGSIDGAKAWGLGKNPKVWNYEGDPVMDRGPR